MRALLVALAVLCLGAKCGENSPCTVEALRREALLAEAKATLACTEEWATPESCVEAREEALRRVCVLVLRCGVSAPQCVTVDGGR